MFKKSILLGAVSVAALAAAGPASAATGHACKTNGLAAGCTSANAIANGTALTAKDASTATADDFQFVGGTATLTCKRVLGAGTLTSNGGAAFPIGGTGPIGNLSSLTLDNGSATAKCNGKLAGVSVLGTITVNDSNGTAAGKVAVTGSWSATASSRILTLKNLSVKATLTTTSGAAFATCNFSSAAFNGVVSNTTSGRVTFTKQPLTKVAAGSSSVCPASGTGTVPVLLTTATGPVYLTA